MAAGGAVDGQVAYCLALFDYLHICKTVLHDSVLVLRLDVERNVLRQMLSHAWFIMVDMIMGKQCHIHTFDNLADRHCQMHTWVFIYAKSRLKSPLVGEYGVDKYSVSRIIDFQGGTAHQANNSFLVHNVTLL